MVFSDALAASFLSGQFKNDKQFLSDVNTTIRLTDGHYEIGLPLKDHNKKFSNNIQQAEVKAAHLKRRFSKNPEFHEEYETVVNDMISKGYAEVSEEEEDIGEPGKVGTSHIMGCTTQGRINYVSYSTAQSTTWDIHSTRSCCRVPILLVH